MSNSENFGSIDIGSSKIVMLIADFEEEKYHAIGGLSRVSQGVQDGKIVNLESVAKIIKEMHQEAKKKYANIKWFNVNISDLHLITSNQNRQISFNGRSKVITKADVIRAIENSTAGAVAANKTKLPAIVNNFTVDDKMVDYPIGMKAEVLGVEVHLSTVSNQSLNNIKHCLDACDIGTDTIVLDSIASSAVCVSQEDKNAGVCLLDIGAAVSNISVFSKGGVTFSQVFKIGGNTVTDNISQAFNTSFKEAERLKLDYGMVQLDPTHKDGLIEFSQIDSNESYYLSRHELIKVIEDVYQEITSLIKKSLKNEKLDRALKSGFLIIGGASKIENCESFLLKQFKTRTKMAKINRDLVSGNESLLNDINYYSAFGLLTFNGVEFYLEEVERIKDGKWDGFKKIFDL
ncbi:Cell division protein FtsA [hydrothermal vent metagenome]|uniref:Cell division protein FtsA n=1 Tax=hydrothermal vent metagenome TaxID=652676 RepID=A0A1W1D8F0_9ZZZZ